MSVAELAKNGVTRSAKENS